MSDVIAETVAIESGPAEEVPAEVAAIDGVLSEDEQHNTERPARKALKKKGPQGKPLSEFEIGQTLKGRVKTIASYGAFIDIGAETDGLLHISQLSVEYVANVKDFLEINKEYDVRIAKIDQAKRQIALSLLSEQEEEDANSAMASRAQKSENKRSYNSNNQGGRKDNGSILSSLQDKGWNPEIFVEGKVVSIVDFGAFVNVDASQLNSDVTGIFDGLVHISAISTKRTTSVSDVLKVDEQVKVRVKSIDGGKVSLTMVSVEDEKEKNESRGGGGGGSFGGYESGQGDGAKDWKESLEKILAAGPTFSNRLVITDRRK